MKDMRACLKPSSAALILILTGMASACSSEHPANALSDAVAPTVSAATAAAAPAQAPPARGAQPAQPTPAPARGAATPVRNVSTPALPEVSYVCPMAQDADVLETKPGKCPKCGMELTPVRIVEAYSCIRHDAIVQEKAGACPIDKSELVKVVASLYWQCAGSDKHEIDPGTCADGKPRQRKVEKRAHGDHNPRHGGQLFMAPDKWHHLEGTYPSAGLLRVYFYDDFTRPMAPKAVTARAVLKDASDRELASIPLKPGRISNTLEGTVTGAKLPFTTQVKVKFTAKDAEVPFDFNFVEYSKEPVVPARTPMTTTNRPAAAPAAAQAAATTTAPAAPGADPGMQTPPPIGGTLELGVGPLPPRVLPTDPKELLAMLTNDSNEVKSLLDQGMLTAVWKPAIDTKDEALQLADHSRDLPDDKRVALDDAVHRLMLAAWQLDSFGDLGDKQKLMRAYNAFAQAVQDVKAIYGSTAIR